MNLLIAATLIVVFIVVTVVIIFIAVGYLPKPFKTLSEIYCEQDKDCACGTNTNTGDCFYGNKRYVNTQKQCPDFCSGFAGNLIIKCVNSECKQISTS